MHFNVLFKPVRISIITPTKYNHKKDHHVVLELLLLLFFFKSRIYDLTNKICKFHEFIGKEIIQFLFI